MLIVPQILAENVARVRSHIASAARVAGRDPTSITLIGVSKSQPLEAIRALHGLGITHFGENYPQEALPKLAALADLALEWHFIGQLQSNKTRAVAEHFAWVHSVDRLSIARRLSEQRPYHAPTLNVCLQVKLADEAGKGGVEREQLAALATDVARLERLRLRGLMCIPPPSDDEREQRSWYGQLRELRDELARAGHALDTLSMGMSGDFAAAIAEGATHLRIGTALFGPRPQQAGIAQ